jgi:beta-lactam-binding protein with PASTA domain/tRNA A-37 threonylcarbamoyl transferase component Bud32
MVGQVLNHRYEILDKIGEGGMAVTYRGRDRVLGRAVAIKVMRPELAADAEFLARFRREARAAAGITHAHIAGVHDTGSDGPYHYIVMEYVAGESLKTRLLREGPLPLEEALRIASETAEALEAAHSAGVVHRDIKPANILLGSEGEVKVTDFGIARAISSASNTETSTIMGTVNYVSPEQARGEAVGPQSDLYSLGVTLFEMLTGRPPFQGGERLAVLHQHIYDRPPRVRELRPGVPAEADSIVAHCLEKELSPRFASARELLGYLAACPRTEEGEWRPGRGRWRRPARAPGAPRTKRLALALGLSGVVLAGAVAALVLWASTQARTALVRVPDIVGMSNAAAQERLTRMRLEYRVVGRRESQEVEAGAVLSQDPPADAQVLPAAVVKVVLSEGPKSVVVPNVTQMSLAQARRNLEAASLAQGAVQEAYDDRVPAGYVASTLPHPGARVVRGTEVDLVVSLGSKPSLPPGPPLPAPPGRAERFEFTVPTDVGPGAVSVVVELADEHGRRTIYEGHHKAGEEIPTQTIYVAGSTTVRALVNGRVRAEQQYQP